MAFNVESFVSELKKSNISKPYLFKVEIAGLNEQEMLGFYCKSTTIPTQKIANMQVPYEGRMINLPGEKSFSEWSITIINDEKYILRDLFELWANQISSNRLIFRSKPLNNLLKDIHIKQLDTGGEEVTKYILYSAYPSDVSSMDLNIESISNTQDFIVQFQYQYYEKKLTEQVDFSFLPLANNITNIVTNASDAFRKIF